MKSSLSRYWYDVSGKFSALSQRERWLIAGAMLVLIYTLFNLLLLEPALEHKKTLISAIQTDQTQIDALRQQIDLLSLEPVTDPDALNKQRIANLETTLASLDDQLSQSQHTLVEPDKMSDLLRSLVKKNGRLKLITLNTLPGISLLADESAIIPDKGEPTDPSAISSAHGVTEATNTSLVYKHGVEITLEGSYLDLLDYVASLERSPWHILWSKAELTSQYPVSRLKLTVYTLSLDKTWLSI